MNYEEYFENRIAKCLKDVHFEPKYYKGRLLWYVRRKTTKSPLLHAYIGHSTIEHKKHKTTIMTLRIDDDFGKPDILGSKGYVIIEFAYNDEELLSARCLSDYHEPDETTTSVISTVIHNIRTNLVYTGYFGRGDI